MADSKLGELFEFMRRPVSEVQRPGGAKFEGIPAFGDMVEVQLGAAPDQPVHGLWLKPAQRLSISFQRRKKGGVSNAGHFYSFGVAGSLMFGWQRVEQFKVVDNG